jgi:hypothetical protein
MSLTSPAIPFVIQTEEQYSEALVITESLFFKPQKTPLENQILEVWTVLGKYTNRSILPLDNLLRLLLCSIL